MPIDITLMAENAGNASTVIFKRVQQDHTLLYPRHRIRADTMAYLKISEGVRSCLEVSSISARFML